MVLALLAAAAGGGLVALLLFGGAPEMPAQPNAVVAGLVALILIAGGFSLRLTASRAERLRRELDDLSQSMQRAIRDLSTKTDHGAAAIGRMEARLSRELAQPRARPSGPPREAVASPATAHEGIAADSDAENGGNVVPYPQAKSARRNRGPVRTDGADLDALARKAMMDGTLDLSLRPIISMNEGVAAGFDVFLHVDVEGEATDIAPANLTLDGAERARFDRMLLGEAMATARRRLGNSGDAMPLHVPVSPAYLLDADGIGELLTTVKAHPPLAGALVLAAAPGLFASDAATLAPLQALSGAGLRLSIEPSAGFSGRDNLRSIQIDFVKAPATVLISPAADGGDDLRESAAAMNATLIAIDVATDDEAIDLMERGINLMSGSRFSGPRRLRPDDDQPIDRLAKMSISGSA